MKYINFKIKKIMLIIQIVVANVLAISGWIFKSDIAVYIGLFINITASIIWIYINKNEN